MAVVLVVAVIVGFVVVRAVTTPGPSPSPSIAEVSPSSSPTGVASPSVTPSVSASPTATASATATATQSAAPPSPTPTPVSSALAAKLIGQKLVIRMDGKTPSADLLGRIDRGEVGGVILFGPNVTTPAALTALTAQLSAAAKAGGQPTFIIAVDQEGGSIKRIPWAPPTMSPPEMGANGDPAVARAQGASTGSALAGLGINVDLAPVADVPGTTQSFMYKDGRTFSFDAATTASLSDAFASGFESAGVIPSMKHFPGIGFAARNTDVYVVDDRRTEAAPRAGSHALPDGDRPRASR